MTGVVDLSWQTPASDGDSAIDAYRVQRMKEWPGTFLLLGPLEEAVGISQVSEVRSAHSSPVLE